MGNWGVQTRFQEKEWYCQLHEQAKAEKETSITQFVLWLSNQIVNYIEHGKQVVIIYLQYDIQKSLHLQ